MASAFDNLQVVTLTKDELDAALECGRQVGALQFTQRHDYEVCDDNKGLESASRNFIEVFAPWSKFGGGGAKPKLQAFKFKKSATLRVDTSMLLVPTSSTTVSGQKLQIGSYMQLTADVSILPEVLCLVFRAS